MDIEQLRELRLAHPFRPFNLILDDGRKLPVDKSYYLAISPTKRSVCHSSIGGGVEWFSPERVVNVDFDDPASLRWAGRQGNEEHG
jgi:hypothetical protein